MAKTAADIARDRVQELADDPRYRPYVVGYLLSCLDERHWGALVQSALDYVDGLAAEEEARKARVRELAANGG